MFPVTALFFSTILLTIIISCSRLPAVFNEAMIKDSGQALEEGYEAFADAPNRRQHIHEAVDHAADASVEAAEGVAGLPSLDPNLDLFKDESAK